MINHREMIELLEDENCTLRISNMSREQLAELFGVEFSILKGYDQNNPHHDRDLLAHTLGVLDGIRALQLPYGDAFPLSVAALLHDIGKPETAQLKQGRTVFYGHSLAGRLMAERLLNAYGFGEDVIPRILFYIGYHDAFVNCKLPSEMEEPPNPYLKAISEKSVAELIHAIQNESETKYRFRPTKNDFCCLLRLCIADASAQAETVCMKGNVVDTRKNKIARLSRIMSLLPDESNSEINRHSGIQGKSDEAVESSKG